MIRANTVPSPLRYVLSLTNVGALGVLGAVASTLPLPTVVGVALTLALFIGLVWRSFWIAQLAARAGLKFPAYLAAGFGLWLGCQAMINIGVNMGVLPTKGLTLPLMSYGRSSMIVTLAWVGLLLRDRRPGGRRAERVEERRG